MNGISTWKPRAGYAAELAEALDHRGLLLLDDEHGAAGHAGDDGQDEHGLDHEADSLEEDYSGFLCVVGLLSRLDPHYTDGACGAPCATSSSPDGRESTWTGPRLRFHSDAACAAICSFMRLTRHGATRCDGWFSTTVTLLRPRLYCAWLPRARSRTYPWESRILVTSRHVAPIRRASPGSAFFVAIGFSAFLFLEQILIGHDSAALVERPLHGKPSAFAPKRHRPHRRGHAHPAFFCQRVH